MKKPQIAMMKNSSPFPAMERFSFFSLGLKKRYLFFIFTAAAFATYSPTLPNIF